MLSSDITLAQGAVREVLAFGPANGGGLFVASKMCLSRV